VFELKILYRVFGCGMSRLERLQPTFWGRLQPLLCLVARVGSLLGSLRCLFGSRIQLGSEVIASHVTFPIRAERLRPPFFGGPNQPAYWRNIPLEANLTHSKSPYKQPESGSNPSGLALVLQPNTQVRINYIRMQRPVIFYFIEENNQAIAEVQLSRPIVQKVN